MTETELKDRAGNSKTETGTERQTREFKDRDGNSKTEPGTERQTDIDNSGYFTVSSCDDFCEF